MIILLWINILINEMAVLKPGDWFYLRNIRQQIKIKKQQNLTVQYNYLIINIMKTKDLKQQLLFKEDGDKLYKRDF